MQITTRTAITAINYALAHGYVTPRQLGLSDNKLFSYSNANDRMNIWQKLRLDPYFNIEVATQIILMNASQNIESTNFDEYSDADFIRLFSLYNGSGDAALEYGKECYNWFLSFEKYSGGGNE